jgi:hypothetical protein
MYLEYDILRINIYTGDTSLEVNMFCLGYGYMCGYLKIYYDAYANACY